MIYLPAFLLNFTVKGHAGVQASFKSSLVLGPVIYVWVSIQHATQLAFGKQPRQLTPRMFRRRNCNRFAIFSRVRFAREVIWVMSFISNRRIFHIIPEWILSGGQIEATIISCVMTSKPEYHLRSVEGNGFLIVRGQRRRLITQFISSVICRRLRGGNAISSLDRTHCAPKQFFFAKNVINNATEIGNIKIINIAMLPSYVMFMCFSSYNYGYQHQIQFQSTSSGAKKGIKASLAIRR